MTVPSAPVAQPTYFNAYANFACSRTEAGVLTVRFHTEGGPVTFTGQTHRDFPRVLEAIARPWTSGRRFGGGAALERALADGPSTTSRSFATTGRWNIAMAAPPPRSRRCGEQFRVWCPCAICWAPPIAAIWPSSPI